MRYPDCAALARAGARLCLGALLAISSAQAAPLSAELARNAALPRAPLLNPELFERPARLREVRLAPDGAHLAWVEEVDGKAELHVTPLAGGPARPLATLDPQDRVHWSRDGAVLFVAQQDAVAAIGVRDGAGGRIAMLDKEGQQRFAGVDPSMPRHALLEENDTARGSTRLVRIGADGARSILYEGPGSVAAPLFKPDGTPAILRRQDRDFTQRILQRRGKDWIEAARCRPLRTCVPLALSADGSRLFLRTLHADDREALVEVPLTKGAGRVVHTDPDKLADLVGVTLNPMDGQPMLAAYQLPAPRLYGIDAAGRRIAAAIARRFPEGGVVVESCAPSACLLAERGARMAQARFWLLDLKGDSFRPVLDDVRARAAFPPERHLAQRIALRYPASDGMMVHGYLTLPPGLPARSLPLVTIVHGGPWGHVTGGYSGGAQLLANRGVAVFEPNFRGSTGYGERYTRAPGADYGNGRVQADIIDGVRWLLAQGVGDPRRLGIAGSSFGGYATLLALSHTPDMFRFGLAGQPPTDFARNMRGLAAAPAKPGERPLRRVLAEVGIDPDDPAQMQPISRAAPVRLAAQVRAPLLVIAGGKDELVEVEAVADYVARLQELGKPVSLLVDPDEGHNARNPLARKAQMHLLLRMLHRYLGAPPPPAPSAELARYLARNLRADAALGR
ncbi:S9 family peptidase [Massilia sp. LjRoot122]|uniref:S9 family peptidase n=1 Tax=Massilia sp. LjRoot122 TaxID=3342257 RepID=UPI003ECF6778